VVNPSPDPDAPPYPRAVAARPLVLLAEDDDEMRDLISLRLRRQGYDLLEAASGSALLLAIKRIRADLAPMPSLIVTDVHMPGLSGLSALHTVRDYGWRVPVVVITAFGSEETLNEAARLDAAVVLHKPFDLDDLRMAIDCLLPERAGSGSRTVT
jgi:DNA-binding response OmpR family regulator